MSTYWSEIQANFDSSKQPDSKVSQNSNPFKKSISNSKPKTSQMNYYALKAGKSCKMRLVCGRNG